MAFDELESATDQLAQQYMETLWTLDSFEAAADLEDTLSTVICLTEEMIQLGKQAYLESFDQAMRRRRAILKRIADALVWRIFGSHNKFLRAYALGKSPGFMAGKAGYAGERFVVAKAQEFIPEPYRSRAKCVFAVQNDITNCLRFGDVTCLMDDGTIVPFEIKTGKNSRGPRNRRQDERHDAITQYLATGFTSSPLVSELPLKRIVSDELETRHSWHILETVVEAVSEDYPCSYQIVDDCMLIMAVDAAHQDVLGQLVSDAISALGWNINDLRLGSLDRHVSQRESDVLSAVMPIINWPITRKVISDVVLTKVFALVVMNVKLLHEQATKAGVRVQPLEKSVPLQLTLSGAGSYTKFEVAEGAWNQLIYELISIPSFVDRLRLTVPELELPHGQS